MFAINNYHSSWDNFIQSQKQIEYFKDLINFLENEKKIYGNDLEIFPPENLVLNSLNLTSLNDIKVVILGQDPYHQKNQAMGLCFSVPHNIKIPPSLKNIQKEIFNDLNLDNTKIKNGDLTYLSNQGILLLNTSLTVRESCPNSHQKY